MASNAVEPLESLDETNEAPSAGTLRTVRFLGPGGALLALGAALLAALAVHVFLANQQDPPLSWMDALPWWQHPYPLLLGILLGATLAWTAGLLTRPSLATMTLAYAPLLAGGVAFLGVLELITVKWGWLPYPYFPGPDEVFGALVEDRAALFDHTWHSLLLLVCGYLAGVGAGLVSGVLIGWFPAFRYWGMPFMKVVGPVPATALVPLAMVLFPASLTGFSGAALIAFAVWFPMTLLTSSGIANVRLSYLDVARTLGAGRIYLIFRVAIPAALPNIFLGLFAGLYGAFLTLIVAETVGVKAGLGFYISWQKGYAEYGKVFAALLIMAVCFSALLTLLFRVRDYLVGWQKGIIKW